MNWHFIMREEGLQPKCDKCDKIIEYYKGEGIVVSFLADPSKQRWFFCSWTCCQATFPYKFTEFMK